MLLTLQRLADHPRGVSLDELARELEAPKSSVHRALATLVRVGFAEQERSGGPYRLGLEVVRMAFGYHERSDEQALVEPALEALAGRFGETAHYARLDASEIVYVAKVTPSVHGVRMTSVIGGRNPAHCTGVGKALLAFALPDRAAVDEYVRRFGPLEARTAHTVTDAAALHDELGVVRAQGYAVDREESELGVNCVAFATFLGSPHVPSGAVSVSAVANRTPLSALLDGLDDMRALLADRLVQARRAPALVD